MKRLYITLFAIIAVLVLAGFIFWQYFFLATLSLDITPKDAQVVINGKPVIERVVRLPKGTHTIEINAPGYRSESFTVKTGYGSQESKQITLIDLPKPTKILTGPIASVVVNDTKDRVFFSQNNTLYQFDLGAPAGAPVIPITPVLSNIKQVIWSPDFKLALLQKTDGEFGLYDFNRYDLLHQEYRIFNKNIKQAVWSPDGSGFYAEYLGEDGEHSFIKANPTNTTQTRLAGLVGFPFKNFSFIASSPTNLIVSSTNLKEPSDLLTFDTHQKNFVPLTDSQAAYGPVVSANQSKIAYIDNGELVIADIDGKNKRNTGVRAKVGNYTFLDSDRVLAFTANQLTVITVADGTKKDYAVYAPNDSIANLFASSDGKTIYYTYKDSLYRLNVEGTAPQPATK